MHKKILFLDLDGTLLNDQREISDVDRAALEQALSEGHRVVVNTGRPLESAKAQNEKLGLTRDGCYLISFNGGLMYDPFRKEVISRSCIARELAVEIAGRIRDMGVHVQTYDEHTVLIEPWGDRDAITRYCNKIHMDYQVVPSFAEALQEAPAKLLVISYTDRPALERVQDMIRRDYPQVECFFSCKEYLEIVPRGVNKGNALKVLCDQLGIPVADSISAGDEANDIAMLLAAGVGCAMANAVPAAKESADYVTENDNNHGGVAEIVRKFMLN